MQAMTGMIERQRLARERPDAASACPMVDITTGLYSAIGILMALHERQQVRPGPVPGDDAVRNAASP